ncbi:Fe-S cluster assembly protein NifU [Phormidium yuhuli AB48]|uniref:Nitrogen fixation protein NifU n=1 Tax=Phormidium yuhuli AB48 TaxID=2940671 RepID=A0ABY5ANH9_9CYAN|nr:Fe-S cluster assembly protein NifU [Phormidium yuhuli]USR90496.1 Fe-S cluster assembly protein NifU [Phormidium yuhuli AB48]
MWDYTDKVMTLFHEPHNMGAIAQDDCRQGEAIAIGEVGSIACGDALRLHLRIQKANDLILDARFQTFGCASAIASSSALTDLIKGKTVDEALQIDNRTIAEFLGGLPQEKMHCSVMGQEALEAAIANYHGVPTAIEDDEDESALICQCFGVTENRIKRVIRDNHLTSAEEVTNYIKAGGGCGSCLAELDDLVAEVYETADATDPATPRTSKPPESVAEPVAEPVSVPMANLTNLQKIALIQSVLNQEIRPVLLEDGGDVDLYDVDGNLVYVSLQGACGQCASSRLTLKGFIERTLRDRVSPDLILETLDV